MVDVLVDAGGDVGAVEPLALETPLFDAAAVRRAAVTHALTRRAAVTHALTRRAAVTHALTRRATVTHALTRRATVTHALTRRAAVTHALTRRAAVTHALTRRTPKPSSAPSRSAAWPAARAPAPAGARLRGSECGPAPTAGACALRVCVPLRRPRLRVRP
jgi:hypothetical protein